MRPALLHIQPQVNVPPGETTLLERARRVPRKKLRQRAGVDTSEVIDMVLALLRGDITYRQAAVACGNEDRYNNVGQWAFGVLRRAVSEGQIKVGWNGGQLP